jgi:hypothetical protein
VAEKLPLDRLCGLQPEFEMHNGFVIIAELGGLVVIFG